MPAVRCAFVYSDWTLQCDYGMSRRCSVRHPYDDQHEHHNNRRADQYDYDSRNDKHNHNRRNHKHYDNCRNDEYDNHRWHDQHDHNVRDDKYDNDIGWGTVQFLSVPVHLQ